MFSTEGFDALGERLGAVDAGRLYSQALDVATDEAQDGLQDDLLRAGAPREVAEAVTRTRSGLTRFVGVPASSPAHALAKDFEYGSIDHDKAPKGIFRLASIGVADSAADAAARSIESRFER